MYGRTHTAPYMYFTATKEEMLSRVPILQPLATGGEWIFQYAYGLKLSESMSNNYQHNLINQKITPTKDIIMVQFHCFNQTFEFE